MGDGALKWNYKGPWVSSTCPNTPVSMGFFLVYVEWCVFNRLFGFMCDGCLLARHACCHTLCLLHPHLSSIDLASHYASVMERFKDTCVHFNLNASSSAALSSAASSVAEEPFLSPSSSLHCSSNALEAFRGLDQLAHEQEQVLLELQDTQGALKALMRSMAEAKDTLSTQMNSHLQQVSTIQSTIRTLSQHLGFFKDATSDAWRHFEELEHLSSLPSSYAATLIEIQRRRLYGRTFSTTCDQMATTLESMRLVEMTARDAFLRQFGTHLPRDFVPGLAENPSFCEFHITTFDLHLPEIDAAVENAILSSSPSPSPSHAPLAIKDAKGSHAEAKDIRSSTSSLERTSLEEDLRMPSSQHSHTRDNMLLSDDPAVETATMATFNLQDMSSDTSLSESMSRGSLLLAANPGYRDPVQLQQRVMDLKGEVAQLRQALQASSIKETTTIKKVSTSSHEDYFNTSLDTSHGITRHHTAS